MMLLRSRLNLAMTRRVTGLMEGRHQSLLHGHGQDFDDLSHYAPGDDIGDIDWRSSARAGIPLIKRYVSETTITVALVVDTGKTMTARSAGGQAKSEVAVEVARLVALLTLGGSDRLALVAGDAERTVALPARGGRTHVQVVLARLTGLFDADAPVSDLPGLLLAADQRLARRSLVVVVTDEAHPDADHDQADGEGPDAVALRRLRTRHDVIVVAVADADPRAGRDVEDGWVAPRLLSGAPEVDRVLAQVWRRRAQRRVKVLHRLGLTALTVPSTAQVLPAFARALGAGRAHR
jgi:uncharacterized protein (DUF58 family)